MKWLIFLILVTSEGIFLTRSEQKLFHTLMENTMECLAQASENFSTVTCHEMLREGNDNSLARYDECKRSWFCPIFTPQYPRVSGDLENKNVIALIDSHNCIFQCLGACAAKRLHLLTEKGEVNLAKFKEYVVSTGSETWAEEVDLIFDKCKNIRNTNDDCDYIFQWLQCGLTNSRRAIEQVKQIFGDAQKNDHIEMK